MIKVKREDVEKLIKNGFLKLKSGRYPSLHITSKQKKGKRKNYYLPNYFTKYIG